MRTSKLALMTLVGMLGLPAGAAADTVFYTGVHPVSPKYVKGMCFIRGPHVHSYVPHKKILYVKVRRHWAFVGDPVEFEPKQPKHAYYGHHPVFWLTVPGVHVPYCYIVGPHYHWHAPPGHLKFKKKGKAYWYVGTHPRWYKPKHWRARALARHYVVITVPRPVVTVAPPSGFIGVRLGPGGIRAHFGIQMPGVRVGVPGAHITPLGVFVPGGKMKRGRKHGHYKFKGKGSGFKFKAKGPGFGFKVKGKRHRPRGRWGGYRKRKGKGKWK